MFDPTALPIALPNSHVLDRLTKHPDTVTFLRGLNVPSIILRELHALSLPPSKLRMYEHQYNLIQEAHPYRRLPFALDDWILAYLAAENKWGVVSMDHHLLTLMNFLPGEIVMVFHVEHDFHAQVARDETMNQLMIGRCITPHE